MYTPPAFSFDERAEIVRVLRRVSFGHLVTYATGDDGQAGLAATGLPFVVDDGLSCARAHFARANRHWRGIDGCQALLIVPSVDAYVSPRWYPSKSEHGKVVPTWNYELIHLHGTVEIHDDPEWKRRVVGDLTDHNEQLVTDHDHTEPWAVSDAPADYVDKQLRAMVGVQLNITGVEAARKLSQNRPAEDHAGAMGGLSRSSRSRDVDAADLMRSLSG